MWGDKIVEDIRKGRVEHAARFNYDVKAIIEALKEEERRSGRKVVSFAEKSDTKTHKAKQRGIPRRSSGFEVSESSEGPANH